MNSPNTLLAVLAAQATARPAATAFVDTGVNPPRTISWQEHWRDILGCAAVLAELGVGKGSRVAIALPNCHEWEVLEKAAQALGALVVGIEPYASPAHIGFILRHSKAQVLVCEHLRDQFQLALTLDQIKLLVTLENQDQDQDENRDEGQNNHPARAQISVAQLKQRAAACQLAQLQAEADDPAVLIYTSGTTGEPKGIVYSHRQLAIACDAILEAFGPIEAEDVAICWLPLANLFQRIMNLCAATAGATTYLVRNPQQISEQIKLVRPTIFIGVPRFYEKLYLRMQSELRRLRLGWTLDLARRLTPSPNTDQAGRGSFSLLGYRLLDGLIFQRLRAAMGGRIRFMITGSAPCARPILEFFAAINMPLLEAYGMSENVVPISANKPRDWRLGSVGKPLISNAIKLNEDGEILVRGPGVLSHYLDSEQAPNFDTEGYLHSGDRGRLDADGFLFLTGRKSELIKTSTGRRISPLKIEQLINGRSPVDQSMVVGDGRKHLVLLVTLNEEATNKLKSEPDSKQQIAAGLSPQLRQLNTALEPAERIHGCLILKQPLSMAAGEITANLKIRRNALAERRASGIDGLYAQLERQTESPGHTEILLQWE